LQVTLILKFTYPREVIRTVIATACLLIAATADAVVQADRIVIQKSARQLTLLRNGRPIRAYHVSLGSNPKGAKEREGDGRTPEGLYTIDSRNAYSKYHLALHVSYPNAADRLRARRLHVRPGGEIMIHGTPNRWRGLHFVFQHTDWTAGCIAVSDAEIEEIWKLVPNGTVVEIRP
jgi:murein L,D-transpeptidase YafK